ncbi:MAG: AAA family ATPase [Nitrososphaerota archaeon]|nr:AAA family ATPase [Nitrososphaerota archaeon]
MARQNRTRRRIGVTGSPATGKRTVAELLSRMLGVRAHSINRLAAEAALVTEGGEVELRAGRVGRMLLSLTSGEDSYIIYGPFLWDLFPRSRLDLVVVLRCNPAVLHRRYVERGYGARKAADNVTAEAIGYVYAECLSKYGRKVRQMDATGRSPEQVAEAVVAMAEGRADDEESVDWLSAAAEDPELLRLLL